MKGDIRVVERVRDEAGSSRSTASCSSSTISSSSTPAFSASSSSRASVFSRPRCKDGRGQYGHEGEDAKKRHRTDLPFLLSRDLLLLVPRLRSSAFPEIDVATGERALDDDIDEGDDAALRGEASEAADEAVARVVEAETSVPGDEGGGVAGDDELGEECE